MLLKGAFSLLSQLSTGIQSTNALKFNKVPKHKLSYFTVTANNECLHESISLYITNIFLSFCSLSSRRIHISRATLDCLEGTYQTEEGHGRDRNEFLRKHNIDTFLICSQEERNKVDHAEPPKVLKTTRTWNPEMPLGNATDMNSVSARNTKLLILLPPD